MYRECDALYDVDIHWCMVMLYSVFYIFHKIKPMKDQLKRRIFLLWCFVLYFCPKIQHIHKLIYMHLDNKLSLFKGGNAKEKLSLLKGEYHKEVQA